MRASIIGFVAIFGSACVPSFEELKGAPDGGPIGMRDGGIDDRGRIEEPDATVNARERRVGWQTFASGAPIGRDRHAMAYSPKDRGVMLHGGIVAHLDVRTETFIWTGTSWIERAPANRPTARCDHALAEDKNGNVVLFGGTILGDHVSLDETWIWDGTDWQQQVFAAPHPDRRVFSSMAYDHTRERIVLYGGTRSRTGVYGDTWEWTGSEWIDRTPVDAPVAQPPPLNAMRLAFDYGRQRVVMVGGELEPVPDQNNQLVGELQDATWEWTGDYWVQVSSGQSPGARAAFAMTYDIARSAMVIFGGSSRGDSIELVKGRWRTIELGESPHSASNTMMAYDRAASRVILYGGVWVDNGWQHGDTTYVLVPFE